MSSRAWFALPALAPLLLSTSCLLNPIGEDPGFDDSPSDALGAAPSESGLGMVSPTGPALGTATSGVPAPASEPEPESIIIDDDGSPPSMPAINPSPTASAPLPVSPSGTSPATAPMGTTAPTPEPGLDFDGGALHYASPTDADGPDGGTPLEADAEASSADAAVPTDAGEVSP